MVVGSLAVDVGTAWLAKKVVEAIGLDLTKVAEHVAHDVVEIARPILPSNASIGRIINTIA